MRIGDTVTDTQADSLIDQITGVNYMTTTGEPIEEVTVHGRRDWVYWIIGGVAALLIIRHARKGRRRRRR